MALTDIVVKNAKPKDKSYKLTDGNGMYLLVAPTGGKLWRLKYRHLGKEKLLSFGGYPDVSLADARQCRDDARKLIAKGIDPNEAKKAEKVEKTLSAENTFQAVTLEWIKKFKMQWSDNHAARILRRLEVDVFPFIGSRPISEIKPPEMLAVLRPIESRTLETAHRIKIACGQIFRYAVATGRAERDIIADLRGALPPTKCKHMAAPTDPKEVAPLLRAIDGFTGSYIVKCAMHLTPILFVRPGELRHAEWSEIDFVNALWTIPGSKMKMGKDHIVPLPRQAIEIMTGLYQLTGHGKYLFPCTRSSQRCMSNNTINKALRRLGYNTQEEITGHGFRAMARTILDEVLGFRPDFIEHQLAHAVKDVNGRAYNRTSHLDERKKMMQTWADYLDGLKVNKILQFKKAE